MEKYWFVAYTKLNCEKKVSALLSKKKIDNYCPMNRKEVVLGNNKKTIETPLFCYYVFVNIKEDELGMVKKMPNVIDFIYWLGMPAIVRDVEIREMRYFVTNYLDLSIEKSFVDTRGVVKIINEPNSPLQTNLLHSDESAVKLYLPSLGVVIKKIAAKVLNGESSQGLKQSQISL